MIISSENLHISYQDLENMFNAALKKEMQRWEKEKNEFFKDPLNDECRPGKYMPSGVFQIWLKIPKNLVNTEDLLNLVDEGVKSCWNIVPKWQVDERTGIEQIYFSVKKMS